VSVGYHALSQIERKPNAALTANTVSTAILVVRLHHPQPLSQTNLIKAERFPDS
jgi:hypothetical protein